MPNRRFVFLYGERWGGIRGSGGLIDQRKGLIDKQGRFINERKVYLTNQPFKLHVELGAKRSKLHIVR